MKILGVALGAGLAGFFVGAVVAEIIHRTHPNLLKDIGKNTKKAFGMIGGAFKEGYRGEPAASEKLEVG